MGHDPNRMASLAEMLTAPQVRAKVVQACVELVESEVASKRGMTGMAIKAGFKVVQALKPGMVMSAIDTLLPEFASSLQGIYDKTAQGAGGGAAFTSYLGSHPQEAADALLQVTDARAQRAKNATLKKTYERMRSSAQEQVASAVPGLARVLAPFVA